MPVQPAWALVLVLAISVCSTAGAQTAKTGTDAATRQLAVAQVLQAREQYDLAAEEWTKFLKSYLSDPRADQAQYSLGICRFKNKQYAEAIAAFQQVIKVYPKSSQLASAWLHLGLAQYNAAVGGEAGLYVKAADNLATVLKSFPQSKEVTQAAFYRGEALYALGKKAEAAKLYSQVVERHPKDPLMPEALYALGVTLDELGQTAAAGTSYDSYLKRFPDGPHSAEITLRRGETLFVQKQFAAAEKWFAAAARRSGFKDADVATFRQATALYEQRKYPQAAAIYASIEQKFPQSKQVSTARLAAGKCAFLAGDLSHAREQLAKCLPLGGATAAEAAHWLARGYLKEQKPDEALKVIETALPDAGLAVQLVMDRADALYEQPAKRREAAAAYADLAQKHPQDPLAPQAFYMAALASLNVGDHAQALEYSEKFLKQFSDKDLAADVEYIAAESDLQLGKYDAAIARYDQLLKRFPQRADVPTWQVRRGLALFMDKRFSEVVVAIEPLLPSLVGKPLLAEASYLLGSSQNELKKYAAALKTLTAGLAADPRGRHAADTLLGLALAERRLNKLADAKAHLHQLMKRFPDSAVLDRAHFRLAEDAYAAGDLAAAQVEYQLVVEKFPDSPVAPNARYGLAWAQLSARDFAGAVATLDTLLGKHPAGEIAARARYARALAREELKQFAPALEDLQAFLTTGPSATEKADARYVLGLCQAGLNQPEEAAQTFRAALEESPGYAGADKVLYELAWTLKSLDQLEQSLQTFRRLAKEHPSSPLAAESLYHVAEGEYQAERFTAAAPLYYEAMQKAGNTPLGEKAAHKLGWAYFRENAFDKAQQSFAYQRSTWPQGSLAPDALFMQAESLFKQAKFADALPLFEQVKNTSGKEFAALSLLRAAQARGKLKQWQASLAGLSQALKQFADSEHVPEMLYEQAWAKQNLGQSDEALGLYEEVTAKSDGETAARARFMIGEIYFERKNHAEAIKNFFKAAYGYGYPRWQANAHYEAGRCFEVLGKKDQAIKSYQEVTEKFSHSDKAPLAKGRLDALRGVR